jgi:predicted O-methyltransferase YrrM
MSSLTEYLAKHKIVVHEGFSEQNPKQIEILKMHAHNAKNILEIGFNAGHGSEVLLKHSNATVTSFDLGEHDCVAHGKKYIDETYPGRHTLILGNSHEKLPEFIGKTTQTFDLMFIDGDHHYEGALKDLMDCQKLATPETIVLFDDVVHFLPKKGWNEGPNRAWHEMREKGKIVQTAWFDFAEGRGMVIGRYLF